MYHKKDDSVLNHFKNFSLESPEIGDVRAERA